MIISNDALQHQSSFENLTSHKIHFHIKIRIALKNGNENDFIYLKGSIFLLCPDSTKYKYIYIYIYRFSRKTHSLDVSAKAFISNDFS